MFVVPLLEEYVLLIKKTVTSEDFISCFIAKEFSINLHYNFTCIYVTCILYSNMQHRLALQEQQVSCFLKSSYPFLRILSYADIWVRKKEIFGTLITWLPKGKSVLSCDKKRRRLKDPGLRSIIPKGQYEMTLFWKLSSLAILKVGVP